MRAPALTQEWFDECVSKGLCIHKAISKLNAKNCKANFSKTIPKALREEDWNAYLIVLNHRSRWKYMGLNVENVAGALKIVDYPELVWTGYLFHNNTWYAVEANRLIEGRIPDSCRIIPAEIELEA